jgi:hypothetical protein
MPRNVYFSQGTTPEKRLYEDITIEALKIYGHDVYYIPRTIVNTDAIFNEDALSKFGNAYQIEMYVENTDGFEGDGDLLSKFGVEVRDAMTLVIATRRWEELVGRFQNPVEARPQEGDLIYFPLVKGLFQITFVEDESPFYQIANLPTFKLSCELFEYGNEAIDTGVDAIDVFETKFATRTKLTLGSGSGTFQVGEDVTQTNSTSGITVTGEVANLLPSEDNSANVTSFVYGGNTFVKAAAVINGKPTYFYDGEGDNQAESLIKFDDDYEGPNVGNVWVSTSYGVPSTQIHTDNTEFPWLTLNGEVRSQFTNLQPTAIITNIEISSQEASDGSNTLVGPTSGTTPGNIVGSTSGASYAITSTNAFSALDSNDPFADNEDFENAISAGDFIDFSEANPFGEVNITT